VRHQPQAPCPAPAPHPFSDDACQRWLCTRLAALLDVETEQCPAAAGATAEVLLQLFERVVQEPFTSTPGAPMTSRIRSLSKVMGSITPEETLSRLLLQHAVGRQVRWNRVPLHHTDVGPWRRREEERERIPPLHRGYATRSPPPTLAWRSGCASMPTCSPQSLRTGSPVWSCCSYGKSTTRRPPLHRVLRLGHCVDGLHEELPAPGGG
jgi:hypothetical protein